MNLAATFAVNGLGGALLIIAVILFLIAAIAAFIIERPARQYWPWLVALGLCLLALAGLVH
jgi:drug/metabolite transporter (DMT)-like permease